MRNVTVELRQSSDNITAVLSWLPPDEPNGVITQYQVFYAGYNGTQVYILCCAANFDTKQFRSLSGKVKKHFNVEHYIFKCYYMMCMDCCMWSRPSHNPNEIQQHRTEL